MLFITKRPLLFCIIAYFLGIIYSSAYSLFNYFLLLIGLFLLYKYAVRSFTLLVVAFLAGYAIGTMYNAKISQQISFIKGLQQQEEIKVHVVSDVMRKENRASFYVKWRKYKLKAGLKADRYGGSITTKIEYGDVITIKSPKIEGLRQSSNFELSTYDNYLRNKSVVGKIYFKQNEIAVIDKPVFSVKRMIYRVKDRLVEVHKQTLSEPYASILGSIIFGSSASPLSSEIQEMYKKVGVIHLLVVSGSQIAILIGVCLYLAKHFKWSALTAFIITSLFNISFTIATGAEASILRACVMAEIVLLANLLDRKKDFFTSLGISAFILSIYNPYVVFDIGFQLSYAATISLIYITPILNEKFIKYLPEKLAEPLSISIAPFMLTTPLALFYFNGLSVVSLPMNLLLVAWVEILVVLGFSATLLGLIWTPLAAMLNFFNFLLLAILGFLVNIFNKLPFAYIYLKQFNVYILCLIFLAIVLFVEYLRNYEQREEYRYKRLKNHALMSIVFCVVYVNIVDINRSLKITLLDVGQGDAIVIETPRREVVVIDCGSDTVYKPGESILKPTLVKKGIKRINSLIITHPHKDHYSGISAVYKTFKVEKCYITAVPSANKMFLYGKVLKNLTKAGVKIVIPDIYQSIRLGDVKIQLLYPDRLTKMKNLNNRSLVYLLKYQDFKMLLTGDLEEEGEEILCQNTADLDIDILKVGHHGSKTSSSHEFLKRVSPELSLISVGAGNKFKHPAPATVTNLSEYGKIYRTDKNGAIEITVNKKGDYSIRTVL